MRLRIFSEWAKVACRQVCRHPRPTLAVRFRSPLGAATLRTDYRLIGTMIGLGGIGRRTLPGMRGFIRSSRYPAVVGARASSWAGGVLIHPITQSPYSIDGRVVSALGWVYSRPRRSSRTTGRPLRRPSFSRTRVRTLSPADSLFYQTSYKSVRDLIARCCAYATYTYKCICALGLCGATTLRPLVLGMLPFASARVPLSIARFKFCRRDGEHLRAERSEASMRRAFMLDITRKFRNQFFFCHGASLVQTG